MLKEFNVPDYILDSTCSARYCCKMAHFDLWFPKILSKTGVVDIFFINISMATSNNWDASLQTLPQVFFKHFAGKNQLLGF